MLCRSPQISGAMHVLSKQFQISVILKPLRLLNILLNKEYVYSKSIQM